MRTLTEEPAENTSLVCNNETLKLLNSAEYGNITELARLSCNVSSSFISTKSRDNEWVHFDVVLDTCGEELASMLCEEAVNTGAVIQVEHIDRNPECRRISFVHGKPSIQFFAAYPLIHPQGDVLGVLCLADEVPGRLTDKQEKTLQLLAAQLVQSVLQQEQKDEIRHFDRLFQVSRDLVCIAGADGFFSKVNPAFQAVLGWDESFLLKTSLFELVHKEDVVSTLKEVAKLTSGSSIINFTNRIRTRQGTYKSLQWTASPEPASGNFFAIARDISADKAREQQLKSSENSLKSFFENSQGLMCTHDLDGRFISVNIAGAGMLGYTVEEVLSMSLYDIVPAKQHTFLDAYLREIAVAGKVSGVMYTRHKNGTPKIWMFNNVIEKNADGKSYVIGNAIDITERHFLEKDLTKTKEMLEQTSKVAKVGGWEFDLTRQKIYWSATTRAIHEVEEDFVPELETALNFYNHGDSRDKIKQALHAAVTEGKPWDLELQIVTAKGREIWVRAQGNPGMENGICKRLYGTLQDINDKKKAELEIIHSRKLFNDVLQSASEVSIIASRTDGIITVFNKGAERLLGYTAEEMVGKQTPEIIHDAEEVRLAGIALTEEFNTPVEGYRVFVHKSEICGSDKRTWTFIRKDGSRCTVSLVVTPIRDINECIIGYLGIATDITQRRKAEHALSVERSRLLAFVDHAPAAVAMFDRDINYVAVSKRWVEEYRLEGKELIGRSHYEVFPNITQEWKAIHQRCLDGVVETNDEDIWRPPGWQQDQYLRWEVRPWYQYDGTVGGIMMFTQDITQVCLQREELRKAKYNAEQASIAKSEFLANMSHEIRTPLNGVIGFTDLVLKTALTDTQKQYLSIVNQSANALLNIINDILDFSKIEAGKLELDISKCDLHEMASQATDIISYQAQQKNLELLLHVPPGLPRFIWADEIRLKQVLINLLGNAIKFTEKGEIELKIDIINQHSPEEAVLRFEVLDSGIGIPAEKQDKIFEAFLQEDASTTRKYGGTGLGLTISNKLLGLMGSRMRLESRPGYGSRFYFDLKVKTAHGEAVNWQDEGAVKHVLIVDDNDNNRYILKEMLLLKNITSVEARNGFDALNLLAGGESFDAIFMDYHMPHLDGLETTRKIRENFSGPVSATNVILLYSSADDEKMIKCCEELKINTRIAKPVKMQELFKALSNVSLKGTKGFEAKTSNKKATQKHDITVLIAEDNSVNMLLAKTIVKRAVPQAVILEARNGNDALAHCRLVKPDIIFMDIQMPEMNGYEATRNLRLMQQHTHVPIIALTAGNVKGEKERCLEAGMNDFITKPFVEEHLLQVLDKWVYAKETAPVEAVTLEKEKRHFNLNQVVAFLDNNMEALDEFLQLSREELSLSLVELQEALSQNNLPALNAAAHKLKGTALVAGMDELAHLARLLETMHVFNVTAATELLDDIKAEADVVLQHINGAGMANLN
ncbi:PAS domain S-box protein [Foetidibacter luteolus]|uniref:PAS domain S-box protein n=1 Tax=Foetidibacter luteolus TaxID=2608880 RepID=UPI00129B4654|nr:PAS domain S-box protein [Foetidibacter luteolus]